MYLHMRAARICGYYRWREAVENSRYSHVSCLTGQATGQTTLVGDEDGESF